MQRPYDGAVTPNLTLLTGPLKNMAVTDENSPAGMSPMVTAWTKTHSTSAAAASSPVCGTDAINKGRVFRRFAPPQQPQPQPQRLHEIVSVTAAPVVSTPDKSPDGILAPQGTPLFPPRPELDATAYFDHVLLTRNRSVLLPLKAQESIAASTAATAALRERSGAASAPPDSPTAFPWSQDATAGFGAAIVDDDPMDDEVLVATQEGVADRSLDRSFSCPVTSSPERRVDTDFMAGINSKRQCRGRVSDGALTVHVAVAAVQTGAILRAHSLSSFVSAGPCKTSARHRRRSARSSSSRSASTTTPFQLDATQLADSNAVFSPPPIATSPPLMAAAPVAVAPKHPMGFYGFCDGVDAQSSGCSSSSTFCFDFAASHDSGNFTDTMAERGGFVRQASSARRSLSMNQPAIATSSAGPASPVMAAVGVVAVGGAAVGGVAVAGFGFNVVEERGILLPAAFPSPDDAGVHVTKVLMFDTPMSVIRPGAAAASSDSEGDSVLDPDDAMPAAPLMDISIQEKPLRMIVQPDTEMRRLPVQMHHHDYDDHIRQITPDTVKKLLAGNYDVLFGGTTIVDCRFPYEWAAGHIRDSRNLFTTEMVKAFFFGTLGVAQTGLPHAVVFHCEFSSIRGPTQCMFLRKFDAIASAYRASGLFFPELYVLEGGYKAFFEACPELCDPQPAVYLTMKDKQYVIECAQFEIRLECSRTQMFAERWAPEALTLQRRVQSDGRLTPPPRSTPAAAARLSRTPRTPRDQQH